MKTAEVLPFPARVAEEMRRRGLTLRRFCRAVELDPSFFSKVLAGKRSPPAEESVLRRIAEFLGMDAAELIVSAGRIPSEWRALWQDPELFRGVHSLATGETRRERPSAWSPKARPAAPRRGPAPRAELSEELL